MTASCPPIEDEITRQIEACGWAAFHAQRRYGLLLGTFQRIQLLQERFPGQQIYNSTALQPFYDSFDMLVIDLCSAAKAWLDKKFGLFAWLAQRPELLRRRLPDEYGAGRRGELVVSGINEAIAELIPDENPVTSTGVEQLRERFDEATQSLRNDRNKVRAHRYEKIRCTVEPASYAVPLDEYAEHVRYLVRHINLATLAIRGSSLDTGIAVPEVEAADLADQIFHGSIGNALWKYRRVCMAAAKESPVEYDRLRDLVLDLLAADPELYEKAFGPEMEE